MLGRLFGKDKDKRDEAVCAECGRTLLAGEWTERLQDEDGHEQVLCSLCGQAHPLAGGEPIKVNNGSANAARLPSQDAGPADAPAGRGATERGENDALWKAIKDRDAQIEQLKEQLARSEGERQELIGRLARLQSAPAAAASAAREAGDAILEATVPADAGESSSVEEAAEPLSDPGELAGPQEPGAPGAEILEGGEAHAALEDTAEIAAADLPVEQPIANETATGMAEAASGALEAEAQAASMTLLQRGVDLLNVSPVPRKIAETNADLGIPTVHVGFEDETAAVTFMWSMGWYRFAVDVDTGAVRLGDRGYAERDDLQPNASVRADGTVQLAAARISRAAAQRQQGGSQTESPPVADEAPTEAPPEKPADEASPAAGSPEILSKTLLGQRTDDERPSWERTEARDFDWDR